MARWQSGTAERLQAAALQLFVSKGFRATTAAEIADGAGLTERTFFRYFSDKRDVLFHGQASYVQLFLDGVESAPADAAPMELIAAALDSAASMFTDERRPFARMRRTVIDDNPELRERERHKSAQLALELAGALHRRGVGDPAATLAAESGATVFGVAFAQWTAEGEHRALGQIVANVLDELAGLTGRA